MEDLMRFIYHGNEVRIVRYEPNEVWWVAKDVCDILGIHKPSQAVAQLDADERAIQNIGRQGDANIINEAGLYSLIFRSNKPEAKEFKRWVTHELLPSLRRSGSTRQQDQRAFLSFYEPTQKRHERTLMS